MFGWRRAVAFGVRQLAAAFACASSLAGVGASKLAEVKAAASCRTPKWRLRHGAADV